MFRYYDTRLPPWRYMVSEDHKLVWRFTPEYTQETPIVCCGGYVEVHGSVLTIAKGYRWDGATGALDTPRFMRPSCLHDIWCQMMETGVIEKSFRMWKLGAKELRELCREEGMHPIRRTWVYAAVLAFGGLKYARDE